jgi:hypothetical protein
MTLMSLLIGDKVDENRIYISVNGYSIPSNVFMKAKEYKNVEDVVYAVRVDLMDYISSSEFSEKLANIAFSENEKLKWTFGQNFDQVD